MPPAYAVFATPDAALRVRRSRCRAARATRAMFDDAALTDADAAACRHHAAPPLYADCTYARRAAGAAFDIDIRLFMPLDFDSAEMAPCLMRAKRLILMR